MFNRRSRKGDTVSTETTSVTAAEATAIDPQLLITTLRALRAQIPEYVQLNTTEARSLRALTHVHPALIEGIIVASSESAVMQVAMGTDPDTMREDRQTTVLWDAVVEELRAMMEGVTSANLVRKHRLALITLQAYSFARQLVRNKQHANLIPHVEKLRRLMKVGRRKAGTDPTTPAATADPALPPD
jgi:hypothetical protein